MYSSGREHSIGGGDVGSGGMGADLVVVVIVMVLVVVIKSFHYWLVKNKAQQANDASMSLIST